MNKLFNLDGRLSVCASFVRKGAALADIGTDHAYLPVWLAKNNIIKSAVAADIRPMPLEHGTENIRKYGCENIVSTRLSDGLDEFSEGEADDIVMAGMGAELIVNIIDRTTWLKNPDLHLILQPMTRAHVLRKYLCENGFEIIEEKACAHGGKNYTVMLAEYSGKKGFFPAYFNYVGKLPENDPLSREYMAQVLKKLRYKSNGMKHDGKDPSQLDEIIEEIIRRFGDEDNDNS